jgi:hypothetical protein
LSDDPDHDNDTPDCDTAPTTNPDGTDGACVSDTEHAAVERVTVACDDRLPAASAASTPNV